MLPDNAKAYFDSLWSAQSAEVYSSLSHRQQEFEQAEHQRGQSPNGTGYAARLSTLYKEDLSQRARTIAETLKKVHQAFDSPLDDGVDAQLRDWGTTALARAREGLEEAYLRHLQRYGLEDIHPIGLEHVYACGQATVKNLLARYLWELRNVPAMHPKRQEAEGSVIVNNHGSIGAVQIGAGSTANVQQQWVQGDTAALRSALDTLRAALEHTPGLEADMQRELVTNIDRAHAELGKEQPHKGKLLIWLGGIGTAVQVAASIQPAYDAVKGLAGALGIALP